MPNRRHFLGWAGTAAAASLASGRGLAAILLPRNSRPKRGPNELMSWAWPPTRFGIPAGSSHRHDETRRAEAHLPEGWAETLRAAGLPPRAGKHARTDRPGRGQGEGGGLDLYGGGVIGMHDAGRGEAGLRVCQGRRHADHRRACPSRTCSRWSTKRCSSTTSAWPFTTTGRT